MADTVYIPNSALVIMAHPDDLEFTCAGTLALWAKAGARIGYVLCTSGDVGIVEEGMTRERATQIRETESLAAAAVIGAEVTFLREPDGLLSATLELRKKLVREIRRFRPEVVMTGDPTALFGGEDYINHPDHRAAGLAAIDAIFPAAGQPLLYPDLEAEGFQPFKPRKVYVNAWEKPNLYVDISETIELKIAALKEHKSQLRDWDPGDMLRQWAAETAKSHQRFISRKGIRGQEMQYAESYRVFTQVSDEDWEKSRA
ncbi:MAG TPA: PIG-L deacetylase family protein [Anaerolineaceae bacterium]|nr:PIG-L deacetylase family protein [Anaerolineaceae bacterium]